MTLLHRAALVLCIAIATTAVLVSCTADPTSHDQGPRPLTTAEAQLLAITRFNNFDRGSRPFHTEIQEAGENLTIKGWIDYGAHIGYALASGTGPTQTLLWTDHSVGVIARGADSTGNPLLPIPDASDLGWKSIPLNPANSTLEALLAGISGLGSDRPDNPLLLQQNGALFLRTSSDQGTAVTVFAAPASDKPVANGTGAPAADSSPLRLWVDHSGLLRRAELRLGGSWAQVEMPDTNAPRLTITGASQ